MTPKTYPILVLALFFLFSGQAAGAPGEIRVIEVATTIGPGVAEFIKDNIAAAEDDQAACIIIELDTPGGLASAMREIEMAILASRVPVIIDQNPVALQLRYLQTVNEIATESNASTIFPIPIDLFGPLLKKITKDSEA